MTGLVWLLTRSGGAGGAAGCWSAAGGAAAKTSETVSNSHTFQDEASRIIYIHTYIIYIHTYQLLNSRHIPVTIVGLNA